MPDDRKRLKMMRLNKPLSTAGIVGGGPFEFGPDDERIELMCAGCGELVYTVPSYYKFRGADWEFVFECRKCGVQNVGPFGHTEAGEILT